MMDDMTAEEKERHERFLAEQDARTLAEARRIMQDEERVKRARKFLMEGLQALEK